jgi:hypothetical protein
LFAFYKIVKLGTYCKGYDLYMAIALKIRPKLPNLPESLLSLSRSRFLAVRQVFNPLEPVYLYDGDEAFENLVAF